MSALRNIQNKKEIKNKTVSHLKVVRGGLFPTSNREKRIEQFWLLCHATFWNAQQFTDAEVNEFKELIREHFKRNRNVDSVFKQLVERVCLAKRYVTRRKGRYISKPIDWLNINYVNGLAGTAGWYKVVEEQRETVPHYNEGIALLAKAVYRFCETRNIVEMINFRKDLIRLKQHDLLQIYMNTIMHIQYFNF
jgi:hypothetical protein